jgi:hypothetical protein
MIFLNLFAFAMRVLSINFSQTSFNKKHLRKLARIFNSTAVLTNYSYETEYCFLLFDAKKAFSIFVESQLIQSFSQLIFVDLISCFFSNLSEEVFD